MPRSTANEGGVETYCAEFLEVAVGEVAPDLATFRSVVEEDPSILKGEGKYHLTITPVALQTAKVLDDIETLLTGIMSPLALRAEIKKLSFWSLEQLKARKAQITERQRLSKLPVAEIKQEIAASRPAQSRYFPYDTLPADLTATELKTILRSYKAN